MNIYRVPIAAPQPLVRFTCTHQEFTVHRSLRKSSIHRSMRSRIDSSGRLNVLVQFSRDSKRWFLAGLRVNPSVNFIILANAKTPMSQRNNRRWPREASSLLCSDVPRHFSLQNHADEFSTRLTYCGWVTLRWFLLCGLYMWRIDSSWVQSVSGLIFLTVSYVLHPRLGWWKFARESLSRHLRRYS